MSLEEAARMVIHAEAKQRALMTRASEPWAQRPTDMDHEFASCDRDVALFALYEALRASGVDGLPPFERRI